MKKTQSETPLQSSHIIIPLHRLIVNETVKRLGGIDILILNAAHMPPPRVFTEYDNPVRDDVINCTILTLYTIGSIVPWCVQVSWPSLHVCVVVWIMWVIYPPNLKMPPMHYWNIEFSFTHRNLLNYTNWQGLCINWWILFWWMSEWRVDAWHPVIHGELASGRLCCRSGFLRVIVG